jgi:hypothetical protein
VNAKPPQNWFRRIPIEGFDLLARKADERVSMSESVIYEGE